jgi:LCP family protein required for cell wall assembly
MPNSPTPAGKSSRRKRGLILLGSTLTVLVIAGLVFYPKAHQRWTAPLGPALELPTYTPTLPQPTQALATLTLTPELPQAPASTLPTATQPTATPIPTSTSQPLCGGPPLMVVLGIGVDTEDDTYTYGLGDAIRIARVDFVTPKVTVLSIPRDLWVEIPGISDHYNITHGKLNQSYLYGSPGMGYYDGPGEGAGLMARTLDLNFGLRVDHYGALNMSTFVRIVDAVGGIDVYLPTDVDGTPTNDQTADMGYFYAGQNHFTGIEALHFSRIRKRYNDLIRMDHQNMVLCALRKKLLNTSVLPKIPEVIAAFQDSVITDLSLEQISQMACLLPSLKRENLIFTGLPDELLSPGRMYSPQMRNETFILEADFNVIRDYVQKFLAGEWPVPDPNAEPTCPE